MRISDWSSDVCSSDLLAHHEAARQPELLGGHAHNQPVADLVECLEVDGDAHRGLLHSADGVDLGQLHEHVGGETEAELAEAAGVHADPDLGLVGDPAVEVEHRSEQHTSELQSLMRISYAVFCLKNKKRYTSRHQKQQS